MIFHLNLEELAVCMRIGIHNWEKNLRQKVLVSVTLSYIRDDYIIDYAVIAAQITDFLENTEYNFLEDAAEALLAVLKSNQKILKCTVKLAKPTVSFLHKVSVTATTAGE